VSKAPFWLLFSPVVPFLTQASNLEVGAGILYMSYPNYIGSAHQTQLFAPFPDINYHSQNTIINKDGIQRKLFNLDNLSIDLSLGGSLPVNSQEDPLRQGMPDLDLALEIGPRLNYQLHQSTNQQFSLRLPLRMVLTTDLKGVDYQGYLITPSLRYQYRLHNHKLTLITGPLWADHLYNNYFYGVRPNDATPQRPSYDASSGYSGYQNSITIEQQYHAWHGGIFLTHFNLHHTTFESSPLVVEHSALFAGTFLSYIFHAY